MFRTTFLGHQGWLFATDATTILVDPLLCDEFGLTPRVRMRVYPPRILDLAAFPPVDAILFTHEHEDHFHIPSLNRIGRDVPIFLSALSSRAARTILSEMGFATHALEPGRTVGFGDLELLPIAPDHDFDRNSGEWDTLGFFVRDLAGHGNFFSSVDLMPTMRVWQPAMASKRDLGLYAMTWNLVDLACCHDYENIRDYTTADLAQSALSLRRKVAEAWCPPRAFLACGDGFSFAGESDWLNLRAFPSDPYCAFDALATLDPAARFVACHPGQTFVMRKGSLDTVEQATPFIAATPRPTWPVRDRRKDLPKLDTYPPASGSSEFGNDEAAELQSDLGELASHLFRSKLFLDLHSLSAQELEHRKRTFALVLLWGEEEVSVLEYDARSCTFVSSATENPTEDYVAVVECWASDLLALFRGQIGPEALLFGHARVWSFTTGPSGSPINPLLEIRSLFHPLRRPDAFLSLYRSWLAAEPEAVPRLAARSAGSLVAGARP